MPLCVYSMVTYVADEVVNETQDQSTGYIPDVSTQWASSVD